MDGVGCGEAAQVSEPSHLRDGASAALWIGSEHPFDLHESYLCFRSPHFGWDGGAAHLWITADSRYRVWVNGVYVARGPARGWPDHQPLDTIDIAPFLQRASDCVPRGGTVPQNVVAVHLYQPGYSHFSYLHRGAAGLLAWLEQEGGPVRIPTNGAWRVRRDPSFDAQVPRVSIYGSGVEDRDMRRVDPWQATDFDATGWAAARVVATTRGELWRGLHARTVPMLQERSHRARLIRGVRGPTAPDEDIHMRLRTGLAAAQRGPAGQADFPVQIDRVTPDDDGWLALNVAAGESVYLLYDLGRNYTFQGWAEVEHAAGDEEVMFSYAEKMRAGELVLSDPATYCRVRLTDRFRLAPGNQIAQGFTPRGGRYCVVQVTGPTGAGLRLRPHMTVAAYPLTVTKPLPLADPVLAGVVTLCETTLAACLQETFVDCCWRESSQWLGDALPQALIMAAMCDDLRPLRAVLVMAAQGAYPDGLLPSILPGEVHAYAVLDYNFTWVELLALWVEQTAHEGQALVDELWPALGWLLDCFHTDLGEDGLLRSRPGRRLFLDWAPLSRTEPSALYNLRYLYALQTAATLARTVGKEDAQSARWEHRAALLAAAIRAAFQVDGVWYDDLPRTTFSQQAATFAVLTGCARDDEIPALLTAVAARSLDPSDESLPGQMVLASPFMHHYILQALRGHGRAQTVVEIIRLRWGRWVAMGEQTTWENWNVDFPDGSICHAFSAHPRHHLAMLAADGLL